MVIKQKKKYVLILASGGIDSTACIAFYKKLKFEIDCLFINYGQLARTKEYSSIKQIGEHYKVRVTRISINNGYKHNEGFVKGRNAFLFFIALMNFKRPNGLIASGIHTGTNYYDCSKDFVDQINAIFDNYTEGTIKIGAPFLMFNKGEIYDYCISQKVPIELTYSCELGKKEPCGLCNTCRDLKVIYDSAKQ